MGRTIDDVFGNGTWHEAEELCPAEDGNLLLTSKYYPFSRVYPQDRDEAEFYHGHTFCKVYLP